MADHMTTDQLDFFNHRFATAAGAGDPKDEVVDAKPTMMSSELFDAIVRISNDVPRPNKMF